jgi:hypothetical protein
MNISPCAKCGKGRLATRLNEDGVCLDCASNYNVASGIEQSSSRAIEIVGRVNQINAFAGAILAVAAFGVGIYQESATGGLGFVIASITLVSWALIRMFIGVAQDIKAIRAKVESS